MRFSDIAGNDQVKQALVGMADSGRVPHAMLFFENEGCGALAMILAYLQYLHCPNRSNGDSCGTCPSCNKISKLIHPDIHFVFPTNTGTKSGKMASKDVTSETYVSHFRELALKNPYFLEDELNDAIGISGKVGNIALSEAKSIISKLSLSSVLDGYKVIVMLLPEKMNAVCANKLLKILEEPPTKSLFLMVTHSPEKVMQTIFSRCQSTRILPNTKEEIAKTLIENFSIDPETANEQANFCGGSLGNALAAIGNREDRDLYMDIFADLLDSIIRRDLLSSLNAVESITALDSREKQKAFITFAGESIRKIFLLQQGLQQIAGIPHQEQAFYENAAKRLSKKFCSRTLANLDQTQHLLFRNVNQKILFTDLVDRMFMSI
jgi:DNA polymerase-3 subunit delta'